MLPIWRNCPWGRIMCWEACPTKGICTKSSLMALEFNAITDLTEELLDSRMMSATARSPFSMFLHASMSQPSLTSGWLLTNKCWDTSREKVNIAPITHVKILTNSDGHAQSRKLCGGRLSYPWRHHEPNLLKQLLSPHYHDAKFDHNSQPKSLEFPDCSHTLESLVSNQSFQSAGTTDNIPVLPPVMITCRWLDWAAVHKVFPPVFRPLCHIRHFQPQSPLHPITSSIRKWNSIEAIPE